MDSRQWREALRIDLRRQNLPADYIDRLVEELSDHLLDTQTETKSMDAQSTFSRLGSPNNIAAAASHEFRRRTFAGRHPWIMFVVSPILIAPLAFFLFTLSLSYVLYFIVGGAAEIAGRQVTDNPLDDSVVHAIAHVFNFLARFATFIIAAWFYCRLAKRNGRDHWAIAACAILALIAGLIVSEITPATHKYFPNNWLVGLAYPRRFRPSLSYVNQVLQLLAPLAIAAWLLLRAPKRLPPISTMPNATAI